MFAVLYSTEPVKAIVSVEPRYNEGSRDWHSVFAITMFRGIEVLFQCFTTAGATKLVRYTEDFVS